MTSKARTGIPGLLDELLSSPAASRPARRTAPKRLHATAEGICELFEGAPRDFMIERRKQCKREAAEQDPLL